MRGNLSTFASYGKAKNKQICFKTDAYYGSECFADGRCCDRTTFFIRPERYAFVLSRVFKPRPAQAD
jgi:hypothetical protein